MMDKLIGMVAGAAPAVATALGGPMAGKAVSMIAGMLGVEDNVESVTKAIQADPNLAYKLRELDLKELEVHAKDRDSARQRETAIATSEHAPYINKVITPFLALGITGLSFILFGILIFVEVKPEAKDILIYILGVLSALVTQVASYYFGSSAGSKDKDDKLKGLVK
jgi:energy-converting hydrogenase Eha subunit A